MILMYPGREFESKERKERINSLFPDEHIVWISDDGLDLPIEQLMEKAEKGMEAAPDEAGNPEKAPVSPVMYVSGKNREQLEKMLDTLEENEVTPLLMAASTPNNLKWTLRELETELADEKRIFDKRKQLENLLQEADHERLKSEPKYAQAVMTCLQMLQADDFPEKLLDMAIAMMEAANQNI